MNHQELELRIKKFAHKDRLRLMRRLAQVALDCFEEAEASGCPAYNGVDRLSCVLLEFISSPSVNITEIEREIVAIGSDVIIIWNKTGIHHNEAHYLIYISTKYLVYGMFFGGYENLSYAAIRAGNAKNVLSGHSNNYAPDGFAWVHQRIVDLW